MLPLLFHTALPETHQQRAVVGPIGEEHQRFEEHAAADPGLRFYELPTIGRIWAPVRNVIDGGMAAAIREPVILQRTLTIYGDVNRVTRPLGIDDRSTIALLLVDGSGHVHWREAGGFTPLLADELVTALADDRSD